MSKLVDKLKQISDTAAPLGFKAGAAPKKLPLILIGELSLLQQIHEPGQSLDAILLPVINLSKDMETVKKFKTTIGNIPYGMAIGSIDEKSTAQLSELACDFIVFRAPEAAASLLMEEKLGKVVIVDSSWTDASLRSLEQFPIDAIMIENNEERSSLTVQSVIDLRRFAAFSGKPVLVRVSHFPSEKDLSALLMAQVRGLAVSIRDEKDLPEIAKLRTTVEKLPRLTLKKPSPTVIVPSIVPAEFSEAEDE
jgi:hypothetical protein